MLRVPSSNSTGAEGQFQTVFPIFRKLLCFCPALSVTTKHAAHSSTVQGGGKRRAISHAPSNHPRQHQ
jgi:hypothetical protein